MIDPLTDEELQALKATKDEKAWNAQCDVIKARRGGQYPPDWYRTVVLSGVMASISSSW